MNAAGSCGLPLRNLHVFVFCPCSTNIFARYRSIELQNQLPRAIYGGSSKSTRTRVSCSHAAIWTPLYCAKIPMNSHEQYEYSTIITCILMGADDLTASPVSRMPTIEWWVGELEKASQSAGLTADTSVVMNFASCLHEFEPRMVVMKSTRGNTLNEPQFGFVMVCRIPVHQPCGTKPITWRDWNEGHLVHEENRVTQTLDAVCSTVLQSMGSRHDRPRVCQLPPIVAKLHASS